MAIPLDPCRSCRSPIRWVVTLKGARMPLDPDPTPDGNVVFTDPDEEDGAVRVLSGDELEGPATRYRYKSHFATCPQARTWSRGQAQKARQRAVDKATR